MILQYGELANDLERIRRFLETGAKERQTSDQRRFGYIACISALYSSFENFVERVAFRFSQMLLDDPSNLSVEQMENLRRRYARNASFLLGQGLGVGRYSEVTDLDVAKSLVSCLDGANGSVDLRLELIAFHNSNLRWDILPELFKWAMPDLLSKIKTSDAVRQWMSLTPDVTDRTLAGVLKNELDDLVERRNEVAHRAIPDEILSQDNLLAKVGYIDTIALGLVASLSGFLLDTVVGRGGVTSLGVPSEYFNRKRIVILPSLESPVTVGDFIVMPGNTSTRWGRVLQIMIDGKSVPEAPIGAEVGILLDFAARKDAPLHLWSTPHSDLASRPVRIFGDSGELTET